MKTLARNSLVVVAVLALGALCARDARADDPVPHDQSVYDAKQLVSLACTKCHGYNGISISPLFPILAAQQPSYIEWELQLFRQRARSDPRARAFMWGIARGLDDEQIHGLAQYFSSQPAARGAAPRDAALAARGKAIYENGVPQHDVLACLPCHGPNAEGVNTFPRLAGQHRDYLAVQLRQFNGNTQLRESEIMHRFTQNLTDDEIAAVSEYLSSK